MRSLKTKKYTKFVIFRPPSGKILPFQLLKKMMFYWNSSKMIFQILKFFDTNTNKITQSLLHMGHWIFGTKDILGDPGLKKFVLLSRNMPKHKNKIQFSWTCSEIFSDILEPLCSCRITPQYWIMQQFQKCTEGVWFSLSLGVYFLLNRNISNKSA